MTFASGAVLCSIEGAVGADTESCCPNARIWSERALGVFQQYPQIAAIRGWLGEWVNSTFSRHSESGSTRPLLDLSASVAYFHASANFSWQSAKGLRSVCSKRRRWPHAA
jgi:hypothetical protein